MTEQQLVKCKNQACTRMVLYISDGTLFCCRNCKEAALNGYMIQAHLSTCNNRNYEYEKNLQLKAKEKENIIEEKMKNFDRFGEEA